MWGQNHSFNLRQAHKISISSLESPEKDFAGSNTLTRCLQTNFIMLAIEEFSDIVGAWEGKFAIVVVMGVVRKLSHVCLEI